MHRVNISAPDFQHDAEDPDGYHAGMARFGPGFGARESGASLYELPPGQALCPYHFEHGDEEWLLVVAGRPSVRTPAGIEQLAVDDLLFFPTGAEGAHQVRNDSDETARVLMWSTVLKITATSYPDSDKIGIFTGDRTQDVMVRRSSNVGYYDGEQTGPGEPATS
jgi:uncharacterized cupin superfamily protein